MLSQSWGWVLPDLQGRNYTAATESPLFKGPATPFEVVCFFLLNES